MAMKPKMAPTTMKTVPSGRELCCINGACFVSGTMGVTIEAIPVNVGKLVGSEESPEPLVAADVSSGTVAVVEPPVNEIAVPVPVFVTALVFPVFAEVFPFVCVAVERMGRSVAAALCADVPIASSESAKAAERNGVFRNSIMMNMLSNCRGKRWMRPWTSVEGGCRTVRRGRIFNASNVVCLHASTYSQQSRIDD